MNGPSWWTSELDEAFQRQREANMNNDDERDYDEEGYNRRLLESGDGEDALEATLRKAMEIDAVNIQGAGTEYIGLPTRTLGEKLADYVGARLEPGEETPPECTDVCVHFGYPHRKPTFYFTFGVGHKLIACLPESTLPVDPSEQEGIPLVGKYVKIVALNENAARVEMHRRWGRHWSSCYDEKQFERACAKYNYTELKL
jgi:hypothetical protein